MQISITKKDYLSFMSKVDTHLEFLKADKVDNEAVKLALIALSRDDELPNNAPTLVGREFNELSNLMDSTSKYDKIGRKILQRKFKEEVCQKYKEYTGHDLFLEEVDTDDLEKLNANLQKILEEVTS